MFQDVLALPKPPAEPARWATCGGRLVGGLVVREMELSLLAACRQEGVVRFGENEGGDGVWCEGEFDQSPWRLVKSVNIRRRNA